MRKRTWSLPDNLPDGITVEMLDEYATDKINAARRASYARHPERVLRQRLTSATNLLYKHGLIDDDTRAAVLERVGGAVNG